MEATLIIIAFILIAPYLILLWLYGICLSKRLIEKEWKQKKGLLGAYERLKPEDRIDIDLARIAEDEAKTAWVGNPTPREEAIRVNDQVYKEGLQERPGEGKWQTPQDVEPPKRTDQPARVA